VTCPFRLLAIPPPGGPVPPDIVDRWLAAGARDTLAVLLRDPGRAPGDILRPDARLAALRRRCAAVGLPLLLAIDPAALADLELPPDLAGLHLRGDPEPGALQSARAHLGPRLLGRACHGEPQPGHDLVDYTLFAPVFAPGTRDPAGQIIKRPAGLPALARWAADPRAWIFALGGVTPATAPACLAAGARGLAGISGLFGEPAQVEQDVATLV
jgi:thiamine monophosphate synthase